MTGPNTGDEFAADAPERTAQDRRDELTHERIAAENVQMRHVPTGEVTTFNRNALESERLFVPALRDSFPRDQFEEFRERAT
jgi:hypothetical protein